jgi:hypothetical protein
VRRTASCSRWRSMRAGERSRVRGTPRIANRLLRRIRDYAQVHNRRWSPASGPGGVEASRWTRSVSIPWTAGTWRPWCAPIAAARGAQHPGHVGGGPNPGRRTSRSQQQDSSSRTGGAMRAMSTESRGLRGQTQTNSSARGRGRGLLEALQAPSPPRSRGEGPGFGSPALPRGQELQITKSSIG